MELYFRQFADYSTIHLLSQTCRFYNNINSDDKFWETKIKQSMVNFKNKEYILYCVKHKSSRALLSWSKSSFAKPIESSIFYEVIRSKIASTYMLQVLLRITYNSIKEVPINNLLGYLECWNKTYQNDKLFKSFLDFGYEYKNVNFFPYCPINLISKLVEYYKAHSIVLSEYHLIAWLEYNEKKLTNKEFFQYMLFARSTSLISDESFIYKLVKCKRLDSFVRFAKDYSIYYNNVGVCAWLMSCVFTCLMESVDNEINQNNAVLFSSGNWNTLSPKERRVCFSEINENIFDRLLIMLNSEENLFQLILSMLLTQELKISAVQKFINLEYTNYFVNFLINGFNKMLNTDQLKPSPIFCS
jgi:hypothetical protein